MSSNKISSGDVNFKLTSPLEKQFGKEITRKCLACGKIMPRKQLLRIMKCNVSKELLINPDSKKFGRSAYVCYNKECIKIMLKKKRIQKVLKTQIDDEFVQKIESVLN